MGHQFFTGNTPRARAFIAWRMSSAGSSEYLGCGVTITAPLWSNYVKYTLVFRTSPPGHTWRDGTQRWAPSSAAIASSVITDNICPPAIRDVPHLFLQ